MVAVAALYFGKFDGKYFVDKVCYNLQPFTMTLELYKTMGW